jgi:hypothetical protein
LRSFVDCRAAQHWPSDSPYGLRSRWMPEAGRFSRRAVRRSPSAGRVKVASAARAGARPRARQVRVLRGGCRAQAARRPSPARTGQRGARACAGRQARGAL